jgi:hypothetical protein
MKYLYILMLLTFPKLYGQVGIGVEDPQALLDVESMLIRGQLISPNPNGTENTYYKILNNGYPGWDHLPQPVDFTGSIMIKDKMILESTNGLLINSVSQSTADNLNDAINTSGKSWVLMPDLKTSFTFDTPTSSISAQFQTMVLKYTLTGSTNNNIVSYTCGFFVKKSTEGNNSYKLKVIRPEVIIGDRNSFKILTVSGVIDRDGNDQPFAVGTSYDIAVACRGRNVASTEYLRIGKNAVTADGTNTFNSTTQSLLTPANIKSTFIVEQYQTP